LFKDQEMINNPYVSIIWIRCRTNVLGYHLSPI